MFVLLYFAVIFLAILQVSSGGFSSPTANFEDKGDFSFGGLGIQSCLNRNCLPLCVPQLSVIPQNNSPSGSIFANVPSVTLFTNKCFQAVYSTDILRDVFDFSDTTASQFSDFVRQYAENIYYEKGIENAVSLAEFAIRGIKPNFEILTLPVIMRVYCNLAAHFLLVNGDLGIHNAEDLALAYIQSIVDYAKATMNSDPTSKFLSIANGFVNFFVSRGSYTKSNAALMNYYFGNEIFVAAVNYRWS